MTPLTFLHRLTAVLAVMWCLAAVHASAAPQQVKDIQPGAAGSEPGPFVDVGTMAGFAADDGLHGRELWRTDGTLAGTVLVKDLLPATPWASSSAPQGLTDVNGNLFFVAYVRYRDGMINQSAVWKSDLTEAGTVAVAQMPISGEYDLDVPYAVNLDGTFVFVMFKSFAISHFYQEWLLWRSDGTAAGTYVLTDAVGGEAADFERLGGQLYFLRDAYIHCGGFCGLATAASLWKTDGTPSGTVEVARLPDYSRPGELTRVGETLFFEALPFSGFTLRPSVLWKTDGTAAGTVTVTDAAVNPYGLVEYGGKLYFFAGGIEGAAGRELWKSDGTAAGTVHVATVPGPSSSALSPLTAAAGVLFFTADDGVSGRELWKTDGTAAGTVRVADIRPGAESSAPSGFLGTPSLLFMSADDGTSGAELWMSDGTAAGTQMVQDINPGPSGSAVDGLSLSRLGLLFRADDGTTGGELWKLPVAAIDDVTIPEGNADATSLRFTVTLSSPLPMPVTVDYTTTDGSATGGSDYAATSGSLTFPPGETIKTIDVALLGDGAVESDESFSLQLTSVVGIVAVKARGTGTIANDDGPPSGPRVFVYDRDVAEGRDTNASFRIDVAPPSGQTVTVTYNTADGTATAGSDYTPTSGTLTFTPGRNAHSVIVPILADGTLEGREAFSFNITSVTGATLLDGKAGGTIDDPPASDNVFMYRAFNPTAFYHFFTTSAVEKESAVTNGYNDENVPAPPFRVASVFEAGRAAIFRMYNPNTGRHYYTSSADERDGLRSLGWVYEKVEGFVEMSEVPGTTALYRLYNNLSGTHLYTVDSVEKASILAAHPGIWEDHGSLGFAAQP